MPKLTGFAVSGSNAWDSHFVKRNAVETDNWLDDAASDVNDNGVNDPGRALMV